MMRDQPIKVQVCFDKLIKCLPELHPILSYPIHPRALQIVQIATGYFAILCHLASGT